MDHLPYPPNPTLPRMVVPYLCAHIPEFTGDYADFAELPIRAAQHSALGWWDSEPADLAAHVQSRLYFGLLRLVLGSAFRREEFIRFDNGTQQHVVTSARLPTLLDEWSGRYFWTFNNVVRFQLSEIAPPLRDCKDEDVSSQKAQLPLKVLQSAESQISELEANFVELDTIAPSIHALIWSIRNAVSNRSSDVLQRQQLDLRKSIAVYDRLIAGGVCPYWAKHAYNTYSIAMLYYIAALKHPPHETCSWSSCTAYDINMQNYKTVHASPACTCRFDGIDQTELAEIIHAGHVPLIQIFSATDDEINLTLTKATYGVDYIAISHVWWGGLGNPLATSLPQCQLRRLFNSLKATAGRKGQTSSNTSEVDGRVELIVRFIRGSTQKKHSAGNGLNYEERLKSSRDLSNGSTSTVKAFVFWMDTLCIPVDPVHSSLRMDAINSMARIYAGASHVLVLDPTLQASLQSTQTKETALDNVCAHIVTSAWNSRCWTYQEARLSQRLAIAVGDSLVDPFEEIKHCAYNIFRFTKGQVKWTDEMQLQKEFCAGFYRLQPIQDLNYDRADLDSFVTIWNDICSRTTTYREDLHGILANMLNLSATEILSLDQGQRTKAIFASRTVLPLCLLYLQNPTSGAEVDASSWIPELILGSMDSQYGAMVRKDVFSDWQIRLQPQMVSGILARVANSSETLVCRVAADDRENMLASEVSTEGVFWNIQILFNFTEPRHINISEKDVIFLLHNMPRHIEGDYLEHEGACLLVTERQVSNVIKAQWLCSIRWKIYREMNFEYLIESTRIAPQSALVLDCGLENWYCPRYNRTESAELLKNFNAPMSRLAEDIYYVALVIWVFSFWIYVGVLIWYLRWHSADAAVWRKVLWVVFPFTIVMRWHVLLRYEVPQFNKVFKRQDYERWTASFKDDSQRLDQQGQKPNDYQWLHIDQFSSKWLLGTIYSAFIALTVTCFLFQAPNLYFVALIGSTFLVEFTSRIAVELIWHALPGFRTYESQSRTKAHPLSRAGEILRETKLTETQLKDAFTDPVYFPETWEVQTQQLWGFRIKEHVFR